MNKIDKDNAFFLVVWMFTKIRECNVRLRDYNAGFELTVELNKRIRLREVSVLQRDAQKRE